MTEQRVTEKKKAFPSQNSPALQTTHYKCQICTPKTRGRKAHKVLQETKDSDIKQQICLQIFITFLTLEDMIKKLQFKIVLKTYPKIGLWSS